MSATGTPGVYTATVDITGPSEYGFKICMNSDWDNYFGGADGLLSYKGPNNTSDKDLTPGTYLLTVDLINQTVTFTVQ
jgi:hypothetical protein